jgi:hypothetical protein
MQQARDPTHLANLQQSVRFWKVACPANFVALNNSFHFQRSGSTTDCRISETLESPNGPLSPSKKTVAQLDVGNSKGACMVHVSNSSCHKVLIG